MDVERVAIKYEFVVSKKWEIEWAEQVTVLRLKFQFTMALDGQLALLSLLGLFDRAGASAGSEPEPDLAPVLCFSTA